MTLLNVENNFSASLELWISHFFDLKSSTSIWAPFVGRLPIDFGYNFNIVGNNEGGVKSHTELADDVVLHLFPILLDFLHKLFGSTLGNGPKIFN